MDFKDPKQLAYLAATKRDLKTFIAQAFTTLYPGKPFLDNWHIDAIVHQLQEAIEGRKPRLIINLPPRSLKSFIVSVALPAFLLGTDPSVRIICVSYSDELAKSHSREFRRLVESDWYRLIFPDVQPNKTTETEFGTSSGGSRYTTSVGGTLTGRGGDFILIDDPIKPDDAQSSKARQSNNEWYRSTLLSRLDDKARSVMILVMQRLHVNDLSGFVEQGGGFHKISFPAIATRNETIPLGATGLHHRAAGEALHPEREDLVTLEDIRDQIGDDNFAAQYQQAPQASDGSFFKLKYVKTIDHLPPCDCPARHWVSIDSALSTSESADYSAISLGCSTQDGHYVLFAERGRWDFEALFSKAMSYRQRFVDITFIVEWAGSGISLVQALRKRGLPCITGMPNDDKLSRAARVLPIFADGRVHLVKGTGPNEWIEPYLNELMSFPNGRFDDQVDSLTQALIWAERTGSLVCSISFA